MLKLLFYVSEELVDVLEPRTCGKYLCLSEGVFVGHLGQYLYIFDYGHLSQHFCVHRVPSGDAMMSVDLPPVDRELTYISQDLGYEYRIMESVNVREHALGVAKNFNVLKAVPCFNRSIMEKRFINWR